MKEIKKKYLFIISVVFVLLWIVSWYLNSKNYIFNIQGYIELSVTLLLFSFAGMFGYIFLMFNVKRILKFAASGIAVVSVFILMFVLVMDAEGKEIIESDSHTIIVSKYSFLFAGHNRFYLEKNVLVSEYVGSCEAGEDIGCAYEIVEDELVVTECGHHSGICETEKYSLKD